MRLIDAEKIRILTDLADENGEAVVTLADVRRAIQQTPTEDAEIVIHGEWITVEPFNPYEDVSFKCPCCKNTVNRFGVGNYCPNCGAKMDGKSGDER